MCRPRRNEVRTPVCYHMKYLKELQAQSPRAERLPAPLMPATSHPGASSSSSHRLEPHSHRFLLAHHSAETSHCWIPAKFIYLTLFQSALFIPFPCVHPSSGFISFLLNHRTALLPDHTACLSLSPPPPESSLHTVAYASYLKKKNSVSVYCHLSRGNFSP